MSPSQLSDEKFKQIRYLIYEESGMYFTDNKKYLLENRLSKRMEEVKLTSFDEYYYLLKYSPKKREELSKLFDQVTINETSFFRNMPQLQAFEKEIVPEILKNNNPGSQKLRIWSAGCSNGQEPYTLAMILANISATKAFKFVPEIIANDISGAMILEAQKGRYKGYYLRNTPDPYKSKYFTKNGDDYTIGDSIKVMVKFSIMNLLDEAKTKMVRNMDVIFCRNVLIYFDDEVKKKVIEMFYESLNPGGYLFIGHLESLHNISRAFKLMLFPNAIVYKKE